jgi:ABC-type multidrug transport system ATPase subunit
MKIPFQPAILELFDMQFQFGSAFQLGPITLKLMPGEILHLQGNPGAGKSTLLALLAGTLPWSSGRLLSNQSLIDMKSPGALQAWRRRVGSMTGAPSLPMHRSLKELLRLVLVARQHKGHGAKREIMRVLTETGLHALANVPLQTLSMAQFRRAQIALASCGSLDLLLLDEPFTHLPEAEARDIRDYLQHLVQHGTSIIVTSHNPSILQGVAARSIELQQGQCGPIAI